MEKEARHVEWARLRIAGRPLITGITEGETPLLWIACRASPRLVHVYCDSQLKVLWRFPSDPIFLLLEKARGSWGQKGCMATPSKINFYENVSSPSLLVVTSDGSVWLLPVCPADGATERPFKRKKESHGVEPQKIGPTFMASQAQKTQCNNMSKSAYKRDEWGLFEDIDIYENMECDDDMSILCEKDQFSHSLIEESSKASMHDNPEKQTRTIADSEVFLLVKQLAISAPQNVIQKTIVNLAVQENLIGIVHGARFAAFGPQDMVIVISTFGLELFQSFYSAVNSSTVFRKVESVDGDICFRRDPTCALIVSAAKDIPNDGYGQVKVLLHEKLFNLFCNGFSGAKPQHLLLKGDIDGRVYVCPMFCPDIKMSSSTILCNLDQPILALFAIPSENAGNRAEDLTDGNLEENTERQKLKVSNSLIVVGQYGRIVAVSCCNKLDDSSCFISNSWTKDNAPFEINLDKNNFDVRDWKVQASLTSAFMLGSQQLCYCAGSEVFILSLFEESDVQHSVGIVLPKMPNQGAKHGIGSKSQAAAPNNTCDIQQAKCVLKEIVLPRKIPVADIVIGVAGKDFYASNTSRRPLVVLTARGRILGVEIPDNLPTSEGYYSGALPRKTWRTWQSNMDDRVKGLINIIDEISRASDSIQQRTHTLNLALSELGNSLKVASSVLSDSKRDILLSPNAANSKNASNTPKCTIKVTPCPVMLVSSKSLGFKDFSSSSEMDFAENLLQKETCDLVRVDATLYNHTKQLLSPHWTLVLELQSSGMKHNTVTTYSSIINSGYGLPPDAHCIIEFNVKLPGLHIGPVMIFTYLCHVHDYHELLLGQFSTDHDEKMGMNSRKYLPGLTCLDNSKIDEEFLTAAIHEEIQKTSVSESNKSCDTLGSVCIPLSQHRIDILSLVSPPPYKFLHTFRASYQSDKYAGLDHNDFMPEGCHDGALGAFSGTLNATLKTCGKHTGATGDALKIWKELLLEELLEKGSLSKAGDKITLSVPGGQIISIFVKGSQIQEGRCLIQLHFEAPSLRLGCLLREALIWRLKACEAIDSLQNGKDNLPNFPAAQDLEDRSTVDARGLELKQQAEAILLRAEAVSKIWNEIQLGDTEVTKEFLPVLEEVCSIVKDLLKVYKSSREN